jgi:Homeodomain-like domain
MTKYRIKLSETERTTLLQKVKQGKQKARDIQKSQVILGSDETVERRSETDLAADYHLSVRHVQRIRKAFCLEGMDIFMPKVRKPRSDIKIDGTVEAQLIALLCSPVPDGYGHWELKLLADKLVELKVIDRVSVTSIRKVLKKMNLSRGRLNHG